MSGVAQAQVSGVASISSVEQTVEMVQPKSDKEIAVANVANFVLPPLEELVSFIPNTTFKLPIIEKNLPITVQGLTKIGLGTWYKVQGYCQRPILPLTLGPQIFNHFRRKENYYDHHKNKRYVLPALCDGGNQGLEGN